MLVSGHFTFSHGHLAKVTGNGPFYNDMFEWEEFFMAYTYWKHGFKLYVPTKNIIYHNNDDREQAGKEMAYYKTYMA